MIDINLLNDGAKALGLTLTDRQLHQFDMLAEELVACNKRFNLTAITEPDRIVTEHFLDSLTVLQAGVKSGDRLLDVGTGGGFPGLPIAIVCPDVQCVLMDSTAKKLRYIEETAVKLGLANVTTVTGRAEELARGELRETFDFVTARAVSDMKILSELCIPYVKPGGIFAAQKSSSSGDEINKAKKQISLLGASLERIISTEVPGTEIVRLLAVCRKTHRTPEKYPREYNKIKKEAGK